MLILIMSIPTSWQRNKKFAKRFWDEIEWLWKSYVGRTGVIQSGTGKCWQKNQDFLKVKVTQGSHEELEGG